MVTNINHSSGLTSKCKQNAQLNSVLNRYQQGEEKKTATTTMTDKMV